MKTLPNAPVAAGRRAEQMTMHRILTPTSLNLKRDRGSEDRNMLRSLGDAACFGGMVGCGETYFPAFALAIGLGETAAGLVASLPLLAGGVIQLVSPLAINWLGSLQRWIVLGALLQGLAFVPLSVFAWRGSLSLVSLLLIASLYWAAGLWTGPAWNTWMERVVTPQRRVRFFARRSRVQQIWTFLSLVAAGLLLQWSAERGFVLFGFAALFFAAGLFRFASTWFLHRTEDPPLSPQESDAGHSIMETSDPISGAAKRLLVYLVLMQAFIQFSGPFFVPYMLEQLSLSYGTFVLLMSMAFVSKVLSMSFWGRAAERFGARRVLWFGGIGLVPLSALWILSDQLVYLVAIQILSGIAWAAYELGFFLMFFETLPAGHRTRLLTYYNFANTLAMCGGALAGAAVLATLGTRVETYYVLFAVSSLGRMLCLGVLAGMVLPTQSLRRIRLRILSVRPGAGDIVAPVVASAEEPDAGMSASTREGRG